MRLNELKISARELPEQPGVYIMRNRSDEVIYVGKAKKLRNRVSQYFQDTVSHTAKTRLMVSNVDHFEVIVASTEFEALVLESSLIKKYKPKYNILLKDDKGYPFIRINKNEKYPDITIANKIVNDGAEYFGPYGSRSVTNNAIKAIKEILKLPTCSKKFPRDIGKERPCLNYHLDLCYGWCEKQNSQAEYLKRINYAMQMLSGDFSSVCVELRNCMQAAAEDLHFELAAQLRDQLKAVENLKNKQLVTALSAVDMDIIGFYQYGDNGCYCTLHFSNGNLVEKDFAIIPYQDDPAEAVAATMRQYYERRSFKPKLIVLPFEIEDVELIEHYLQSLFGKKVKIHIPKRGDLNKLSALAQKNAQEELLRCVSKEEHINATLCNLGRMAQIKTPTRIESYDISNISGTDIVGSMVVFVNGKPRKSEYKRFKIENMDDQDDYASMRQVIIRRFNHYLSNDEGFEQAPDLLLIDGGVAHAQIAYTALQSLGLDFPILGMVKDDRHRTRALVTPDGKEIHISTNQSVYALIGTIQEQTHNFAISYHRKLRSNRMRYSQLDAISGVGPKRKSDLIKYFKSIQNIKSATIDELERVVPFDVATNIYKAFHS